MFQSGVEIKINGETNPEHKCKENFTEQVRDTQHHKGTDETISKHCHPSVF